MTQSYPEPKLMTVRYQVCQRLLNSTKKTAARSVYQVTVTEEHPAPALNPSARV